MRTLLAIFALISLSLTAAAPSSLAHVEWHQFLTTYSKAYASDAEHDARYETFRHNLDFIRSHNAKADLGLESYWVAVNKFADLSVDEFTARLSLKPTASLSSNKHRLFRLASNDALPTSVDWRQKGLITPVKDQGQCGSCWSFATTGSMEGAYALDQGDGQKPASFSEQELIDCVRDGAFTCSEGGDYTDAFAFVIENGTIAEGQYGYVSGHDQGVEQCRLQTLTPLKPFAKYVTLESGDEQALKAAVAERPGVAVAIDASHIGFQFYFRGVYKSRACSSTDLDHAVLVVGYGNTRQGGDYWLVKNSWGSTWGQQGYIWMARNHNNMCGIATEPAYVLTSRQVDPSRYVSIM